MLDYNEPFELPLREYFCVWRYPKHRWRMYVYLPRLANLDWCCWQYADAYARWTSSSSSSTWLCNSVRVWAAVFKLDAARSGRAELWCCLHGVLAGVASASGAGSSHPSPHTPCGCALGSSIASREIVLPIHRRSVFLAGAAAIVLSDVTQILVQLTLPQYKWADLSPLCAKTSTHRGTTAKDENDRSDWSQTVVGQ